MKQEDNEKIREAFEPIYQWLKMLSGGVKMEGFHTDKETKNANKSLKASIKKERKMMAMLIIWFIAWTCITYFLSWLLNVLRSHGFSVIDNHYILTLNFFITFIGIIVIIWKLEKIKKQNKQNYDLEITQKALQEVLPSAVCRPDDFIDPNRLYHLGIIPQYTEADGSYLIEFIENGQKCCISNLSVTSLLEAAHILGWADEVDLRTNPHNGLCMGVLYHKAYDAGIFSISPDFKFVVSKKFEKEKTNDPEFSRLFLERNNSKIRLPNRFIPNRDYLEKQYNDFLSI